MKHKITISMMVLGLALPVMNLQAQDAPRPERPRGDRPGGPAFLAALDTNKDRKLDKDEINASTEALKKLDKDSDGKITLVELRQSRGERQNGDRPQRPEGAEPPDRPDRAQVEANAGPRPGGLPPVLAAIDTNKNGVLETDELAGAPAALLKLDKNSDGELTREELQANRGPRGGDDDRGPRGAQKPPKE
jgi:hypothetical protein